jgi:hypothetical protein
MNETLWGRFQCQTKKKDNFKPRIGNKSFHELNNGNEVRVVNFPHQKSNHQE